MSKLKIGWAFMGIRIKVAVGIAAIVWFGVAFFTKQSTSTTALRTFSMAGSVVTIVFLLYDQYIWKWRIIRLFTGKPLIAGTWRGVLQSDYIRPGQSYPVPPIETVIRVKQTDSSVSISLFTGESESISKIAQLAKEGDGRWCLTWRYLNTPRPSVRDRSAIHEGTCSVYISGRSGETLIGKYYTDRKTTGEITFSDWSPHAYSDVKSALTGSDFQTATPFAKWHSEED